MESLKSLKAKLTALQQTRRLDKSLNKLSRNEILRERSRAHLTPENKNYKSKVLEYWLLVEYTQLKEWMFEGKEFWVMQLFWEIDEEWPIVFES